VAEANGTDDELSRAHDASDEAYDRLADIWNEIDQARPVALTDFTIRAELVVSREKDLGGPYVEEEIERFCREIEIAAAFVSANNRLIEKQDGKRVRKARKATGNHLSVRLRRRAA
jgi:hypothetical protein